jgi:hypothetical protein
VLHTLGSKSATCRKRFFSLATAWGRCSHI